MFWIGSKMAGNILGLLITLVTIYNVQCQNFKDPPVFKDSFIAWGEIVEPFPETDDLITIQMAFEESYDAKTKNSAFLLNMIGKNITFVKNFNTNQTFMYLETNATKGMECSESTEKEWKSSDFLPGLLTYEDDDGTIKFSLTQLFNLPNDHLHPRLKGMTTTWRDIPATSWTYELTGHSQKGDDKSTITIEAFFSNESWSTSAGKQVTPLGFNITKLTWTPDLTENYVLNIFGFVPDAYDHKYFEPYQGVICANRKSTLKFPLVRNIKAISLHSEVALPDYQELRYMDMWFDPSSQLVRIDIERMKDENPVEGKQKHFQSEVAIGKMGIVYRWSYYKGETDCEVITFDKYTNDLQNVFDIKQNLTRWQMGKIFGLNDTSYVYVGQTTKNDVPCQLFQGIRSDWPDKSSNYQSLWEWCFNINMTNPNDAVLFRDKEIGLISANVKIISDPKGTFNNFRLNHHFYEVRERNPQILDAYSFDIGRCYKDNQKRMLQFYLNVTVGEDNKFAIENATSGLVFLQRWKSLLYQHTEIPPYSLRISNVRSTIGDNNKLYIKFTILPFHANLPDDLKKGQPDGFDAEKNLRAKIDDEKVFLQFQLTKGNMTTLAAVKRSVDFQIDPKFEPRTLPPPPPITTTMSTRFPFSLITEPDDRKTSGKSTTKSSTSSKFDRQSTTPRSKTTEPDDGSTKSTKPDDDSTTTLGTKSTNPDDSRTTPSPDTKKRIVKYTGHQPGAVAGVSIAMLLAGISVGAAGTFYKFNGLPSCMQR